MPTSTHSNRPFIPAKERMKISRQDMPEQTAGQRSGNFKEVNLGFTEQLALLEAQRCIQCKEPKCIRGCPVMVNIPRFIKCITQGDLDGAAKSLFGDNVLPSISGRVCPQEDQCEGSCIMGIKGQSVAIGHLERFVADWARNQDGMSEIKVPAPSGKKVAVIGGGPAGLSAAGELVKNGDFKTMDFTYLNSITGDDYNAIFVKYDSPYTDLKSLVAAAKTSRITMSGSGIGTNSDMARTLLQNAAGVTFEYVSFDSGTEGATAVAGVHTVSGVGNMVSLKQLADAKKIRILACIGNKRHPNFPEVPTAPEEGFSAATMDVCVGMIAPPNMPADLSKKISDAINAAASDQQFKNDAVKSGSNMVLLGPSDFKSQVEKIYQQADALKDQMKSK